ncbi:MAG: ribulose-bisphosphate carboxylase large subunit [Chloroflexota bacterium]
MTQPSTQTGPERTSGVHSYQELYLALDYVPAATDLLVAFKLAPREDTSMEEAAAAVAAESSTGTWTEVSEDDEGLAYQLRARVYRIAADVALIAYPIDLFEFGSIPNILSSVVGNVFGFKAVSALRLLDMRIPLPLVESFPGPAFGISGVREKLNVHGRAMTGSTIKPKLGLSPAEHARRAYETLRGGIDTVKDDENLNSQAWSPFDERIRRTLELVQRAEAETGERKGYWANVTAAETSEMLRRANLVADEGGRFVMVDFLTAGFAATASLRAETERLGLALHAHRAMHAVMDRHPDHGVDFLVIAKWARLMGADHVHVGTGVGKLEGTIQEMGERRRMMTAAFAPAGGGTLFDQAWGELKPLVPVASGGLHPGHVPQLDEVFGTDAFFLFGGGVHGHPGGSRAGATAARVAVEAVAAGQTLAHAARTCPELRQALDLWSGVRF